MFCIKIFVVFFVLSSHQLSGYSSEGTDSSQPESSPKDPGVYLWIVFAVIYVILVVSALIWALKSFCEIKQNESIEYKRIRVLASYLDAQDLRNAEQKNTTGVVQ